MKKFTSLLIAMLFMLSAYAQVEMSKTKNSIIGKGKVLASKTDRMMVDNFSINLILYNFEEDQAGNNAKGTMAQVGVRASLVEVDEALAKEIVNESYDYFQEQWKSRGVEVYSPTVEEIEASKKYSKQSKKGKANIASGGVWDNQGKKHHNMMAWPDDVNIPSSGSGPLAVSGNYIHLPPDYKGNFYYTGYSGTINFITFKTAKLGSTASVKSFPQLKAANTLTVNAAEKTKVAGYIGSNGADGIEDFYTEIRTGENAVDLSGMKFGGNSKLIINNYVVDKAKFKANVMEMIKKGMDDMFTDYDAVVLKQSS